MNTDELKDKLDYFRKNEVGIQLYFLLVKEQKIEIKLADIDDEDRKSLPVIKDMFLEQLGKDIIDKESLTLMDLSAADERSNVIYKYDINEKPHEFKSLQEILSKTEYENFNFLNDSLSDIKAYIVLIGDSQNKIALYKQHYGIFLYKQENLMFHKKDNERLVRVKDDILKIDSSFQYLALDDEIYIKDLEKLEKFFGIHDVIRKEATNSIKEIEKIGLVEDVQVLLDNTENISFARKLIKIAENSPVIGKIPNEVIIEFTKTHPALKDKLKYTNDNKQIRLDTKVSQQLFVQLLGDSFLRSDLTKKYYASIAKDRVEESNLEEGKAS